MRDHWLDEHVGGEAVVRPEFESSLGLALQSEWRQPAGSVAGSPPPSGPSRRAQVLIWTAAAAVLLVGGAVVLTQTGKPSVSSSTGVVTVPATSAIAPTVIPVTAVPAETNTEPTAIATTTALPPTTVAPMVVATSAEQQTVLDYLTALAEERYDDAAKLLGEGGLSLEDRSDLRPFLNADGQIPDLTSSLKAWCEAALCQLPTALAEADRRVIATFSGDGVDRDVTFVPGSFEGAASVRGLPLQVPAGASLADTVLCPTKLFENPRYPVYADLDGDRWYEQVTLSPTSGDFARRVVVCGTSLVTTPLLWQATGSDDYSSTGLIVLDVEGDGTDELLAAIYFPDDMVGELLVLSGSDLILTGATVQSSNVVGSGIGTSFGCADLDGDGTRSLVNYNFRFIGGFDISSSTAVEYEATGAVDASSGGQLALPAEADEAFRLISGYCGNFPTQTG